MNNEGPLWPHVTFWAAGLVLAGIVLIGAGFSGGQLSVAVRAVGTSIEVTWDNGNVLVTHGLLNVNDPHISAVRVWGGNACWITVNDKVADAKEGSAPVICAWSREQT